MEQPTRCQGVKEGFCIRKSGMLLILFCDVS